MTELFTLHEMPWQSRSRKAHFDTARPYRSKAFTQSHSAEAPRPARGEKVTRVASHHHRSTEELQSPPVGSQSPPVLRAAPESHSVFTQRTAVKDPISATIHRVHKAGWGNRTLRSRQCIHSTGAGGCDCCGGVSEVTPASLVNHVSRMEPG